MIVSVDRYRAITGDVGAPDVSVSAAIEHAVEDLEDELGRPIEQDTRTEIMWRDRAGWVWPLASPISAVVTDGWRIEGHMLQPSVAWQPTSDILLGHPDATVEITYTGGWTVETLPSSIVTDLCWAAHDELHPPATRIPAGAVSVNLGDAAVTFGPRGAPRPGQRRWSKRTLRWKRRPA